MGIKAFRIRRKIFSLLFLLCTVLIGIDAAVWVQIKIREKKVSKKLLEHELASGKSIKSSRATRVSSDDTDKKKHEPEATDTTTGIIEETKKSEISDGSDNSIDEKKIQVSDVDDHTSAQSSPNPDVYIFVGVTSATGKKLLFSYVTRLIKAQITVHKSQKYWQHKPVHLILIGAGSERLARCSRRIKKGFVRGTITTSTIDMLSSTTIAADIVAALPTASVQVRELCFLPEQKYGWGLQVDPRTIYDELAKNDRAPLHITLPITLDIAIPSSSGYLQGDTGITYADDGLEKEDQGKEEKEPEKPRSKHTSEKHRWCPPDPKEILNYFHDLSRSSGFGFTTVVIGRWWGSGESWSSSPAPLPEPTNKALLRMLNDSPADPFKMFVFGSILNIKEVWLESGAWKVCRFFSHISPKLSSFAAKCIDGTARVSNNVLCKF